MKSDVFYMVPIIQTQDSNKLRGDDSQCELGIDMTLPLDLLPAAPALVYKQVCALPLQWRRLSQDQWLPDLGGHLNTWRACFQTEAPPRVSESVGLG